MNQAPEAGSGGEEEMKRAERGLTALHQRFHPGDSTSDTFGPEFSFLSALGEYLFIVLHLSSSLSKYKDTSERENF